MQGMIMRQYFAQQGSAVSGSEGSCSKAYCKTGFDDILAQIKASYQKRQISDQDLRILYTTLLGYYVGCLVETEFEAKMAKWSNRLFRHWTSF